MSNQAHYELEPLLNLRQQERDDAESAYAQALRQYHQAGETVRQMEAHHRRLLDERRRRTQEFDRARSTGHTELSAFQHFDHFLQGLHDQEDQLLEEIRQARQSQLKAQTAMRAAHHRMLTAIKAQKAVEKHRETWEREQRIQQERRAANQLDEIGARLWRENQ